MLSSYIDPVNIPKQYGGELEFEFGMTPKLDPTIAKMLRWSNQNTAESAESANRSYPIGPLKLVDQNNEKTIVAVGSVDGKERRETIATFVSRHESLTTEVENSEVPKLNNSPPLASTAEAITVKSS